MIRLRRSILYVPAGNPRALQKARTLKADAIILDLEDAVSPDHKDVARAFALSAAAEWPGAAEIALRINGPGTPWHDADIVAAAGAPVSAIVLPKVHGADDVSVVAAATGRIIWPMMETAAAILDAGAIARAAAATGPGALVLGTNDLAAELGVALTAGRAPLALALQTTVLAAKAAGIDALDGVFNALGDEAGLTQEAHDGRRIGMAGKTVIHPNQIAPVNAVFCPSADAVDTARRIVTAMDEAHARGAAVATLDGRLVETLHANAARRLVAIHDAILEREAR